MKLDELLASYKEMCEKASKGPFTVKLGVQDEQFHVTITEGKTWIATFQNWNDTRGDLNAKVFVAGIELIPKLIAALELAIKQRNRYIGEYNPIKGADRSTRQDSDFIVQRHHDAELAAILNGNKETEV